jgi:hypothetical protein
MMQNVRTFALMNKSGGYRGSYLNYRKEHKHSVRLNLRVSPSCMHALDDILKLASKHTIGYVKNYSSAIEYSITNTLIALKKAKESNHA